MVDPSNSRNTKSNTALRIAGVAGILTCALATGSVIASVPQASFDAQLFAAEQSAEDQASTSTDFSAAKDDADAKANKDDEGDPQTDDGGSDGQTQPEVDVTGNSGTTAFRQSGDAAGGSVSAPGAAGTGNANGSGTSAASGPVIVDGTGGTSGSDGTGGNGSSDTPGDSGSPTISDPDPVPDGAGVPNTDYPNSSADEKDWSTDPPSTEEINDCNWYVAIWTSQKNPTDIGELEHLYKYEYLNDAKLLRTFAFYAESRDMETGEVVNKYRITNFSDVLTKGAYPEQILSNAKEITFTFNFPFKEHWYDDDGNEIEAQKITLHVYDCKVHVEGIDSDKTAGPSSNYFIDLDADGSEFDENGNRLLSYVDLTYAAQQILFQLRSESDSYDFLIDDYDRTTSGEGLRIKKIFQGWAEAGSSNAVSPTYTPGSAGYSKLSMLPLADLSSDYTVRLSFKKADGTQFTDHIAMTPDGNYGSYHQQLTGYTGSLAEMLVPQGVRIVNLKPEDCSLADDLSVLTVERVVLPNSVEQIDFKHLAVSSSFEVAADSPWYVAIDGDLYRRGQNGAENKLVYKIGQGAVDDDPGTDETLDAWISSGQAGLYDYNDPTTWPPIDGFDPNKPTTWGKQLYCWLYGDGFDYLVSFMSDDMDWDNWFEAFDMYMNDDDGGSEDWDPSAYDINDPSTWPPLEGFDGFDPWTWDDEDGTYSDYYDIFFDAYVEYLFGEDDPFGDDEDESSDSDNVTDEGEGKSAEKGTSDETDPSGEEKPSEDEGGRAPEADDASERGAETTDSTMDETVADSDLVDLNIEEPVDTLSEPSSETLADEADTSEASNSEAGNADETDASFAAFL